MTIREKVLAAYRGCCAWCGRTTGLEIDHIHGEGNSHRRTIRVKLHVWLWRQYTDTGQWPTGFQLLCTTPAHTGCHDRKSGRTSTMSVGKGKQQHNILLTDELSQHLVTLAEKAEYRGKKSEVIERALLTLLEGNTSDTVTVSFHDHLSKVHDTLTATLQALDTHVLYLQQSLQKMQTAQQQMLAQMQRSEQQAESKYQRLLSAYDGLKAALETKPGLLQGLWSRG